MAALLFSACGGSNSGEDAGSAPIYPDAFMPMVDSGSRDAGPSDTDPGDTDPSDSEPADGDLADSGPEDGGAGDALPGDANETNCAEITTDTNIINFIGGVTQATLRITNSTNCPLAISSFRIVGFAGDPNSPSIDDFSTELDPVKIEALGMFEKTITYANNDLSVMDLAELRIHSNAVSMPEYAVLLNAEDDPCRAPTSVITVVTLPPYQANMQITVNGSMSDPGGTLAMPATINGYRWSWLNTPGPQPALTAPTGAQTSFTPTMSGSYILGLHVANSCGRMSPTEASSTFVVP